MEKTESGTKTYSNRFVGKASCPNDFMSPNMQSQLNINRQSKWHDWVMCLFQFPPGSHEDRKALLKIITIVII